MYPVGDVFQPLIQAYFGEETPSQNELLNFYETLGFFRLPRIAMPVAEIFPLQNWTMCGQAHYRCRW